MTQPTGAASPVRWSHATDGWEYRCNSCARKGQSARFWPLTDEFWDKRRMTMCRACLNEETRVRRHRQYWASEETRRRASERARKAWARIKSDPAALADHRERVRNAARVYRARQKEAA